MNTTKGIQTWDLKRISKTIPTNLPMCEISSLKYPTANNKFKVFEFIQIITRHF